MPTEPLDPETDSAIDRALDAANLRAGGGTESTTLTVGSIQELSQAETGDADGADE
jgi:hypothetical protein